MEALQYFVDALGSLCTPLGIAYIVLGSLAGVILGAIPGLGGGTLIVVLVPITYKLDLVLVMALLISIMIGSTSGGCIGSVLLGIPGTQSSICTTWDGYEFAKQGDPVRALSAAVVSNFVGNVPGVLLAIFTCKFIAEWAVTLGPWEYAAMCFCAITTVVSLSKGNFVRSFWGVALAILMVCIGADPITASMRFTFGSLDLYNGLNIINVMLGLFAAKIMLVEYAKQSKVDMSTKIKVSGFRFPGKDIWDCKWNMLRSWITGAFIGFLPGLGGPAAAVIAYSNENNLAKDKEKWGHGAIGGVISCETANNAAIGGAMIPAISLGIPGDVPMVQVLAVLTMNGINVGPILMRSNPDIVYMLFTAGLVAGIFVLLVQALGMPLFPAILKVPYHYLYSVVVVLCFTGAYMNTGSLYGLLTAVAACLLGLFMDSFKIPSMPFMMTYILAPLLEKNIRQGFNYSANGAAEFFTRPISCLFIVAGVVVVVASVVWPLIKKKLPSKAKAK